jgi:hypothetical protein
MGLVLAFVSAAGAAALVITPWSTAEEPRVDLFAHTLAPVDLHGVWMDQPNGNVAYVVGDQGTILHGAVTANRWSIERSGTDAPLRAVAASVSGRTELAVAVGDHGTIVSRDASGVWTREESGTTEDLEGVATTGGFWYAVGKGGVILRRDSGATHVWEPTPSGTKADLLAVVTPPASTWAATRFAAFAVGRGGAILELDTAQAYVIRSASWRTVPSGTKEDLLAGAFHATGAVAVGRHGAIVTMMHGVDEQDAGWKLEESGTEVDLESASVEEVAWPKKHRDTPRSSPMHASFVAVGHGGVALARKVDGDGEWVLASAPLGGDVPPGAPREARDWSGAAPVLVGAGGVVLLPTTSKPVITQGTRLPQRYAPPLPLPFSGIDD